MIILIHVFWEHTCAFLLYMYLGVKLLDDKVYIYLILIDTDKSFSKVIVPIYTSINRIFFNISKIMLNP